MTVPEMAAARVGTAFVIHGLPHGDALNFGFVKSGEQRNGAIQHLKATAGGMDQWGPADLKLLSTLACKQLVVLFGSASSGAELGWLS